MLPSEVSYCVPTVFYIKDATASCITAITYWLKMQSGINVSSASVLDKKRTETSIRYPRKQF